MSETKKLLLALNEALELTLLSEKDRKDFNRVSNKLLNACEALENLYKKLDKDEKAAEAQPAEEGVPVESVLPQIYGQVGESL